MEDGTLPKSLPSPTGRPDRWRSPIAWIAAWRRRRRDAEALVEADARELITQHGVQAYGVVGWRAHQVARGKVIDESRPAGHWRAVKRRVARLIGHDGLDGATRRELPGFR